MCKFEKEIVGLHGKAYNGTPYTVSITVTGETINELVLSGKACKAVKDMVEDFANLKARNATNVIDSIKITMIRYNEYVQTLAR